MIARAISGGGLVLALAGSAWAQTAMDVMGGMAVQEQEQAAAGAAAAGTRSIVGAVFGGAQAGARPGAAPAPEAAAPSDATEPAGPETVARGSLELGLPERPVPFSGTPAEEAAELSGRDPFRPFTLDLRPETHENEILTPLQRYEIRQLRLAGVVLDLAPPRAMLQDNSGMGFIVTPGTPIGRRRGVVTRIEPRRVIVEEQVLDYYGREQLQQVAIEMPKEDKPQSAGQE